MSSENLVGGTGVVQVGELLITVTPLSQGEEVALRRRIRKAAEVASSDYFTRCARLLKAMEKQPGAYLEAVREITRLTATGPTVSDDQVYEFRESVAGVAMELFTRGSKATSGLTLEGLQSCITDANVDDVLEQLGKAMGSGPNG